MNLVKIKNIYILYFTNYLPLQIWTLKVCNCDILIAIKAKISTFVS